MDMVSAETRYNTLRTSFTNEARSIYTLSQYPGGNRSTAQKFSGVRPSNKFPTRKTMKPINDDMEIKRVKIANILR